jgi:lipopolysaccharide/colanic/teichoic acid biosynthesis glycosyltransferase
MGLVALSPLLALVAAIIRLDSKGSPLYGSEREGKDGRAFTCWKFRTMFTDAHAIQHQLTTAALDGPHFKMDRDPRVTRIGRWLRTANIDELPQLYNVLMGTMSLVGPRPSPFRENQICVPWRDARLSVRPGMTGLWQVCRQDREAGDFHQWIEYDLLYVRHISVWLDVKILAATLLTLGGQVPVPATWMIGARAASPQEAARPRPVEIAPARKGVAGRIVPTTKDYTPEVDKPSAKSA